MHSWFITSERWFDRNANLISGFFILVFILSGIFTLDNYGFTWDEGLGNIFYGERNLHFFTSLDSRFLNFDTMPLELDNYPLRLRPPFNDPPYIFPPLADTLSTASMYIFSYWLKWLNPIDGFHLFPVLLAGLFLWVLYKFTAHRLGKVVAFLSILFLGTFPRFWGDMHFNVKDIPMTIFYGLTLMAYYRWYERPSWQRASLAGLLIGCAFAVKANAIFIPITLFLSILPWRFAIQPWTDLAKHFKRQYLHYLLMASLGLLVYILSWPYLFTNPYLGLKAYWGFIFRLGTSGGQHWQIDAFREVLATMPEIMLALFLIGLAIVILRKPRENTPIWSLLSFWAIIPVLRQSLPGANNFDGIRHFLEFVPAAAIIAAISLNQIALWVAQRKWLPRLGTLSIVIGLIVANLVQAYALFYPYTHLYYNQFTGGLSGARDHFLGNEATDYWAGSYRPGMEWLNEHAPYNSYLIIPVAGWVAELQAPILLRPDIEIVPSMPDDLTLRTSDKPYFVMFILRRGLGNSQDEVDYTIKYGTLVHQIVVDQVPIFHLYRFGGR